MPSNTSSKSKRALWQRVLIWLGIALLGLILIVLVAGLIPVSLRSIEAQPSPIMDYDEAASRINQLMQWEAPITKESGRSIFLTHGQKTDDVVVLVHGVTTAPRQFLELGQMLYDQGVNVLILRMPYHGLSSRKSKELAPTKVQDLTAYADTSIDIAAGLGERVTVIGLSGGATISAWMAQNRAEVDRAIILSPFIGFAMTPMFLDTFLMNAFVHLPDISVGDSSEKRDWVYPGESTHSMGAYMQLGQIVLKQAQTTPPEADQILILTTAADDTADNGWAQKLAEAWQSQGANIDTYEFPKSDNIPHASVDPSEDEVIRQKVYDKIFEWLEAHPAS